MPRAPRESIRPGSVVLLILAIAIVGGCADSTPRDSRTTTRPTTAAPSPEPAPPRTVSVVLNGDVLLHNGLWSTAQIDAARTGRGAMDFRPLLANVKPLIAGADLAVCHLETPLAPPGGPFHNYPLFSAPPAIAPALKSTGFDVCTTASNHSVDQGFDGLVRTLDVLRAAGLQATGTAATKAASQQPLVVEAAGVKIGIVSATYGTNGLPLPENRPWSVSLIDTARILKQAARARAAGAEIVLVALHWGNEYWHTPSSQQVALADELTRSPDIDLVYGHHTHVVQPFDKVNGKWVLYGLGNLVAQQDPTDEDLFTGVTGRVTFTERPNGRFKVSKLEYFPTRITHYVPGVPMRVLDVRRSLRDPGQAHRRAELRAAQQRVRDTVGELGAFKDGLVAGR